jgi:hypothetical protein
MLLMLPTSCLGKVIAYSMLADPKHVNWYLVPAQRVANPFLEFCTARLPDAVLEANKRADNLAVLVIGQANNTNFGNRRVL